MSDENNNEEQENSTETKTYTKEDMDRKSNNFIKQITDLNAVVKTLQEESMQRKEQDDAAESDKLKANEDYEALIAKMKTDSQAKYDEYEKNNGVLQSQLTEQAQDNIIMGTGIKDEFVILGLKAKYASTEDAPEFGEWLKSQDLKPVKSGQPSGSVGTIHSNNNTSLDERLNSPDKKIKAQALQEQLALNLS